MAAALTASLVIAVPAPARADYVRDLEYWLDDYGISDAWDITRGAGQRIAVIDTGIADVPELRGAVVGGTDESGLGSPDGRTPVGDGSEHGTLVGSILAGRGDGGSGVIGVAPDAELLSISVAFGEGPVGTEDQIANAVRWAVDNGADIINMSLTTNTLDWPTSWDDAFLYAFEHDVVIVAAAGNRGAGTAEVGAPATIPGVVAVAGVDKDGDASADASSQGITLAVAAPSEQLIGIQPDGEPVYWSGTSGAAPIVAGIVALIRAAHPELDANSVIQRLIATAKPQSSTVPDPLYGYGLVDADAAVRADIAPVTSNPLAVPYDLAEWIRIYRRADAAPAPTSSPTPETVVPSASPEAIPQRPPSLPELIPRWLRSLIPHTSVLTDAVLPLGLLLGFGAFLAAGIVGTVRAAGRSRRR
ncbi:S8 family serine peptidase [Naasia lichenicola]|uniref:S8 family serine peptidase n=1 Tax=Naasia lichenicola TaxID=2565933 RepID=UPI001E493442|nr:S8 family serine peptidase [Naasia lichenicola]